MPAKLDRMWRWQVGRTRQLSVFWLPLSRLLRQRPAQRIKRRFDAKKVWPKPLDSAAGKPGGNIIFVGGVLANGLIAMRLEQARPELRLILFESTETLGGIQTWCFHEDDLTASQKEWLAPLVVHRWNHYSVHFPNKNRQLLSDYHAITSERFNSVLQ